jgi:hypothetical protein
MKINPLYKVFPSTVYRYPYQNYSQDTIVNSISGRPTNKSYRDINNPIHVEPAAKLFLSPDALAILTDLQK